MCNIIGYCSGVGTVYTVTPIYFFFAFFSLLSESLFDTFKILTYFCFLLVLHLLLEHNPYWIFEADTHSNILDLKKFDNHLYDNIEN